MTQLWSSQTTSTISRRFWSMQSPLRLQIPARIPPHTVWHAYSLRLKASEKHQISRHNTEKTSTMLQGGKKWEKWGYALCLEEKQEYCFFKTDFYQNKPGRQALSKPVFMAIVQIWKFPLCCWPQQWHNPSSPWTLSNPTHWTLLSPGESSNSWFSYDTGKVVTARPRRWDFSKVTNDSVGFA